MVAKCELKLLKRCALDMLCIDSWHKTKLWVIGLSVAILVVSTVDHSKWPFVLLMLLIIELLLVHTKCKIKGEQWQINPKKR